MSGGAIPVDVVEPNVWVEVLSGTGQGALLLLCLMLFAFCLSLGWYAGKKIMEAAFE